MSDHEYNLAMRRRIIIPGEEFSAAPTSQAHRAEIRICTWRVH
jgi:hypothetical protein